MALRLFLIDLWQAVLLKPSTKLSMRPVAYKLLNSDNLVDSLSIQSVPDLAESPYDLRQVRSDIYSQSTNHCTVLESAP